MPPHQRCASQTGLAFSLGCSPSPHSRTLTYSHTAIRTVVCCFNSLFSHNPCKYMNYPPQGDERLSWPSWLTHSGQFTHKVVICQPQMGRRSGQASAKDRRPNRGAHSTCVTPNGTAIYCTMTLKKVLLNWPPYQWNDRDKYYREIKERRISNDNVNDNLQWPLISQLLQNSRRLNGIRL